MKINKLLVLSLFILLFTTIRVSAQGCDADPCDGKTYTQGAWGAGNNNTASQYLISNFNSSFPTGLTIGCGNKKLVLTSPAAIAAFLPSGSTPSGLPAGTLTNPGSSYSNVLAGQLVTLILNAEFDEDDSNFSPSAISLSHYTITSGPCAGMSVGAFITLANSVIGGCSSQYSYSQINSVADAINQNYDNGTTNNGYMKCGGECNVTLNVSYNPLACFGGTTAITISASGGTTPYTGTGTFVASAGSHTYQVMDAYGCTASKTLTIAQPAQLLASSASGAIACYGGSTNVTITASGGTTPYTGTGTFSKPAGVQSFTVTDNKGCKAITTPTIIQPSQLVVNATSGVISCYGGSTTVTITASGGTSPYTNCGTFTRTAGIYSFTVTDNKGCSAVTTISISQPTQLAAIANAGSISCFGGSATVTVTASGGTPAYTGTGTFTRSFGTHSFTVTDSKGCTAVKTITLTQSSSLTASATCNSNIACFGGTTTVNIIASGGTAPYMNTGSHVVSAGPYSYTITDANNCTAVVSGTIVQPSQLIASATNGTITCGGTTTVNVTASGGFVPYSGTGIFTVNAGAYSYTVTDANGCKSVASGTITQPSPLTASATCNSNIACFGGTTTVNIIAAGGTAPYMNTGSHVVSAGPYSYTITDANNCTAVVSGTIVQPSQLIASATNGTITCGGTTTVNVTASGGFVPYSGTGIFTVNAGAYSYTVTDANGCKSVASGTITQPSPLTASATCNSNIACFGGTTTVNIIAAGGTAPYMNTGSHVVSAGPYSYTITDANNCTAVVSGTIVQPSQLIASATNGTITCGGTTTVNVTASGGFVPYSGTGIFTVNAGAYSYTVTDANGCKSVASGTISSPPAFTGTVSHTDGTCSNGNLGSASVTVFGGTAPYTYLWSNNASSSSISSLTAGTYSVLVSDANACSIPLSTNISTIACCNVSSGGSINGSTTSCGPLCGVTLGSNAGSSGGIGTIQYIWIQNPLPNFPNTGNNGWVAIPNSNSPTLSVGCVSVTTYFIRCSKISTCPGPYIGESNMVSVLINSGPVLNITNGNIPCNGGTTTINISASGGTSPYSGTGIFTVNAGAYSYMVTDANGCKSVASGTITQPTPLTASATCNSNIACFGGTTTVNIIASGGTAPYTNTGSHVVSAGPYSYTITDANNCTAVVSGTIVQPSQLIASATNGTITCGGTTTVNVTASGGFVPYSGTGIFTVNAGGYSYTVTDANGCKSVASGTITQPSPLTASATCNANIACFGGTTTVNIIAAGGTAPYMNTGSHVVSAGPYSYTITDANNCTAVVSGTIVQPSQLIASATNGTITCGGTTTVNVTASGGFVPYSGTGIFTVNAGAYSYTVTDANGCKSVASGTITQPSPLTASATCNANIACFGGTTTVNIIAAGGTAPYTNTGSHFVSAGPYSYTITDANGCSAVVNGTITQPSQLVASASHGTIACGGTTTVNVMASGGFVPYSGTGIFTVNAGAYSYTVTDANGCKSVASGTITQPSPLTASATCNANIACFGGTTTVNIIAAGGTAPYMNTGSHVVSAGPYSYTITDANNCTVVVSGTITQPSQLIASATNGTITCGGTTTVNVTASGGFVPYSGTGIFTVNAGAYSYTVTDANGCKSVASGTITQPSPLTASATCNANIACFGGTTTVNIIAAGGTAPYMNTGSHVVSAGPYSYTITDANNCTVVVSGTITQPSQLIASATNGTITCGGTTTVNVTASGGFVPYSGTGIFTVNAGAYSYTVTDANGCKSVASGTITQPSPLTASATCNANIACFGGTTTVNIIAAGGTAPYMNTGSHVVSAGPYSYTITDANNCTVVVSGTITQPSQLIASATNGTITCGGTTTVNVTASGGFVPYSGTGIFTVNAGVYSYTVTDANGCKSVASGTITQPTPLTASATCNSNIACFGGTTTVNIIASGGTAPYTNTGSHVVSAGPYSYTITDANNCTVVVSGTITQPSQLIASATNGTITCGGTTTVNVTASGGFVPYSGTGIFTVNAGVYSYTVTDANGCKSVASGTITQPSPLTASATCNANIACFGGTTTVNIIAAGGTAPYMNTGSHVVSAGPYSYTITDANGCSAVVNGTITQPSQLVASASHGTIACGGTTTVNVMASGGFVPYSGTGIFTVNAGAYSYTVTDANGCKSVASGTITQPSPLTASATCNANIACFGGTTTVNIIAAGGSAPYTNTGSHFVSAGPYSYTITDANGCSAVVNGTITQPSQLVASETHGTISGFGGTTTVNITATGGTSPYTGVGTFTAASGTHTYLVTDANGCSVTVTVTLTEPGQLVVSTSNGTILCNGGTTTVNISATGGVAPYTGTGTFTASAGTHTYLVSDANDNSVTVTVTITEPSQLVASTTNGSILCNGGTTTINITATGGTSPYSGTGIFTVNAGPYSYTITDANGCSAVVNGTITQPSQLVASETHGTISGFGGTTTVNITATGGTSPYTGVGTFTAASGTHTYLVTDANGCSVTVTVTLTEPGQLVVSTSNGTILCNGGTTTVNISATGGVAPYSGTGTFTASAGTHTYLVTDANNNSVTTTVTITEPSQLVASETHGTISGFGGTTTVNISASGGTSPYNGVGTFTAASGTHTYLVTDANGCSVTVTVTLTEPGQLVVSTSNGTILCNGGTTTVNISATGGVAPYTGTGTFTASAGTHTYLVSDANDNSVTTTVTITEPSQLVASTTNGSILCNGGTTTINITATGGTSPYSGTGIFTVNAGPYSYTITDANGCSAVVNGTITQPSQLVASETHGTISGFGGTTTVNITATGGTSPYTGVGTFTAASGTHTYLVTDANGCSVTVTVTLTEPGQLVVSTSNGTILCNGGTTTVNISATGGVAPYSGTGTFTASAGTHTYLVTDANNNSVTTTVTITEPSQLVASETHGTISGFGGTTTVNITATGGTSPYNGVGTFTAASGTHTYLVTDANGCSVTVTITLTEPGQLVVSTSNGTILCNGGTTTVNISATGGVAPYAGTGTFTASAGTHTYLVSDANNNSVTVTVTIVEPSQLVASTTNGSILCNGGTTTINITATGGTSPYSGTGIFTVNAGPYSYTITDANGCSAVVNGTITQPSQLVASETHGTISGFGGTTTVNITATGGTSPYTGVGTFTAASGTHTYLVTDANGCSVTVTVTLTEPGQLVVSTSNGTILCNGGTTTVNISATGGVAPYSGTGTFTASAGTHTYLVTDANNNSVTTTVTITEPSQLVASETHGTISGFGGTTTVNITAAGGTSPYNGVGTFTAASGTHTYLVTDANGCSVTVTVTLTEPGQLVVSTSNGTILCNGGTTTVNISATGGVAPYAGTGTFTASAGTHTYLVSDANNNSVTVTVTIVEPSQLVASTTNGSILCNGGTTTINITATGGTSPYSGTGIFTVNAGPYSYTITDANGCSAVVNGTITEPSQLAASATSGTISGFGGTTTVNISASGGTSPYNGVGTFTAASGTHTYLVTDANGCSVTVTITLTEPGQLVVSTSNGTILCNGGTTTVNISATGGVAPYAGTGTFTASAGTHTYLVSDANNNSVTVTVTIVEPSQLVASTTNGSILCNGGTTTINITATGGTSPYSGTGIFTVNAGPYSYTITDANGCSAVVNGTITQPSQLVASETHGTISGFGGTTTVNITATGGTSPYTGVGTFTAASGTHTYLVTDANGCSVTVTVTLTEPGQLVVSTSNGTILCNGGTTTVNISATGGVAPYSGTGTFTASAGTHTYLVTDANNNSVTTTVTITEPSQLVASETHGTISGFGGTTTVNITAAGGTSPYNGVGTFTAASGTHTYLVTDANGCSVTVTVTLTEPGQLVVSTSNGTILCNGGTTTVNISATGGVAPYAGTGTFTASAGTHTYLVSDANNNSVTVTVTIVEPSQLVASTTNGSILCNGGTTTINITATGGTSPYSGTGIFTVNAGPYSYTITDANGCSAVVNGTITQPSQLVASETHGTISGFGGTTTVNITATGGTSPYTGVGTFTAASGTHTYLVTDANGCSVTVTVTLTEPGQLVVSTSNGTILCNGGTTTVNISATGGVAPYSGTGTFTASAGTHTYLVTDANNNSVTTTVTITEPSQLVASETHGTISGFGGTTTVNITATGGTSPYNGVGTFTAASGTHTYLVTDANGCSVTVTVTLTEPGQLVVSTSNGTILCNGGTTTVNISATGGVAPYAGTGTFTASAGTHTYLVSDANNNSVTTTVTITEPSPLVASTTNGSILCNGGTTTINITATGGTSPYSGTGIFTVNAGPYSYTITDANGCSAVVNGTITQPSQLVASETHGTISGFGGTTTVNITATGGTSPYTGVGTFTAASGTHTYLVTDANGCSVTVTVTLTEPGQLVVSTSNGTILCNGGTTTVNISATGGVAPYAGTGTFTASAGTHTYLVSDANNNSVTTTVTITEPSQLVASETHGTISGFGGTTTVNITATGGTSPYTGVGTFTAASGTHTYLVTDANGCSVTLTVTLTEPGQLVVSTSNGTILCNGGTTTVNISATGGVAPYTGTGTFTASAGTHTYLVSDANNNSVTTTVTITEPSPLVASTTNGSILCNGGTTTINITATGGTSPYSGTGIFTVNAGPYSYTITDANGCSAVVNGTITQPSQLVASETHGTISGFGGTTTVNITATGGTSPYTGVGTFTAASGTHTYLVTDANGCSVTVTVTLTEPGQLVVSTSNGTILCNGGTTTVNISATGGVAPYSGTGTFTASAGTHTYLVTDANNNSVTTTVTITEPSQLVASETHGTISGFGGTTTVNITATGGTSPYNGVGTFTAASGTHTYLVTDANGCSVTLTVTLTEPGQLVVSTSNGTILCNGGTTTVNISATGGVAPYTGTGTFTASAGTHTYLVSDANNNSVTTTVTITEPSQLVASETHGTISGFGGTTTVNITATGGTSPYTGVGTFTAASGTHTYLVTDANGCSVTVTVTLTEPGQLVVSTSNGTILCNGGTTTVNISATGGIAPYSGTGTFTASAGTHTYLVTDANNNSVTTTVTITEPSQLVASATSGTISGFGGTTTVNISATGGTSPYNGVGTFTAASGTHTYLVTDANGCSVTVTVTLTEPGQLVVSTSNGTILCNGGTTTVNISATGGVAPYAGTGTFTASAGTHTYLVSDANNNSVTVTVTIVEPSQLVASTTNGSILCNGGTTTINITATGGTSPYSGTGIFTVNAGPYSYTITDVNGCSAVVNGTITQPSQLVASETHGTISGFGGTTTVNITATGGTSPYTGVGTFTAASGTHTYLVTDANGCSVTVTVTLTEPGQLVVSTSNGTILCNGGTTTVNISATGGVAPYAGTGTFTASAGTHTYLVSDANNNSVTTTVTITEPSQLVASETHGTISGFGGTTTVNITATGGTSPYNGVGTFTAASGTHTYLVTDANGCSVTLTVTLTEPGQLVVSTSNGTILCNGGTTTVNISATGGVAPYTGTGTFTASAGTHTYLVSDANNNSVTTTVTITEPSQLVASETHGTISGFGGTTTVNITATGGTSPYTGVGTFTAASGTHTYLVTDANGCSVTVTVTLTEPGQLVVSTSNGTILCNGGTTTVNISATGGIAPYSGTGTFTASAGTHTYLVTDANNNSVTTTVTITEPSQLVASATSGTISGFGGTTTVNISATGGTSPYNGVGTFTAASGTHTYLVTDANGCSVTVTVTLTEPGQLVVSTSNGTILCNGGTTTVNIFATGGVAPYSGTGTFTASAGTHTYLVSDANNNFVTATVTITEPSQLTASATNGTILCNGGTTTVNITATGGTAPYTNAGVQTVSAGPYSFTVTDANGCAAIVNGTITQPSALSTNASNGLILCNGGTTTVNITATGGTAPYTNVGIQTVSAGPYSFTVTDANGCTAIVNGTITQPSALSTNASNGLILCNGGTTTVNITATGGTAPYTNVGIQTVSAGPYSFTVTDANGCTAIVNGTITQPSQLTASVNQGTIACGGTTTINITAIGGTAPYTNAGVQTVSAGPYSFTVTDTNGCTAIVNGTITQPSALSANASNGLILCNGGTTTVNITATGGTAPYTNVGIQTVSAGPYSFTVTDANGCTAIVNGTITQPSQLTASVNQGTIACGGTTTINITAIGGTAPYTNAGVQTVSAGPYSFTVTDANGCTAIVNGTITQPSALSTNASNGLILCNGGTTTVNITATGGTAPYTNTGIQTVSAGPYSFTVTDANGCTAIVNGTITQPSALSANASNGTILCNGGTTTVNITATGGTSPYTNVGIQTVSAGPYSFTVTDANGCTAIVNGTITQPSALSANASNGTILCNGGTTTVNITATGGTAPYTNVGIQTVSAGPYSFTVTDANGCTAIVNGTITQPSQLTASVNQGTIACGGTTTINITAIGGTAPYTNAGVQTVSAGPYSFTVTDTNGCTAIVNGTITQPSALSANASNGLILCNGGTTTVNITATGGTAPYTNVGIQTVSAGPYSFTVTDANGCTAIVNGTITQPSQLTASVNQGTIACGGTTTINITAIGGTAPYTNAGVQTVSAGPYSFTVTDANGCTAIVNGTITQPSALSTNASNGLILCNGGTTTVNITATGGTAPYTNAGVQTVSAGPYSFTVTDANGCAAIVNGTITQPSALSTNASNGLILCNGGTTTVNITATGGTAPYTNVGIQTVSAGPYSFTVTDANGCTAIVNGTITQPSALSANASNGTILCNGGTTTVNITATGGTAPYTNVGIQTVSAGPYSFTVTDANGCTAIVNGTITQPSQLTASVNQGTIACGGTTTINITAIGGTAPYTNAGVQTVSAGPYSFTVTDTNGCTAIVNGTITQPSALSANASNGLILCNGGTTTVNITATGGTAPYTNVGIQTVSAGPYSFTVTDANGCTAIVNGTITQPSQLTASVNQGTIACGGTTTINITAIGGTAPYTNAGVQTVSAGPYSFTVTDANGCTAIVNGTITQPSALSTNASNGLILCNGGTTTVNITATGGTSPYNGTGTFTTNAGTQTYLVIDANGCSVTATVSITEPAPLILSYVADSVLCNGSTANATINASGGTAPYNGIGIISVSASVQTFVVTDAGGCSTSTIIAITEPAPIIVSSIPDSIPCNGGSANIQINASGGSFPYSGTGFFVVTAGIQTFVVTDATGCSASAIVAITEPAPLVVSFVADSILCNGGSASATINATGGTAPYSGTGIYNLTPGFYSNFVTDANGCVAFATRSVTEPPPLITSFVADTIQCNGGFTTIRVTAWGGTAPYSGTVIDTVFAGTYSYMVTDANGCSTSTLITVTEPPPLVAGSFVNSNILCHGGFAIVTAFATGGSGIYLDSVYMDMPCMNDSLRHMLAANGGTVPYWGPGTYPVPAGTYTYGVVDSHCCWDTAQIVIPEPPELVGIGILEDEPCFTGGTTVTLTAGGGTSPYIGLSVYTVSPGTNTFEISDANGCLDTVNVVVPLCAGLEDITVSENSNLRVYPNPNNGTFRISGAGQGKGVILTQSGQLVKEITFNESEEVVIDNLAEGMYFLVSARWRVKIVVIHN